MGRKLFVGVSIIAMLILAIVVARLFSEPVPAPDPVVAESNLSGNSVSGPLEQASPQPVAPPLPPASSMVMSTGDVADLPVSPAAPAASDAMEGVVAAPTEAVPVTPGAVAVTEPPRETVQPPSSSAPADASVLSVPAPEVPADRQEAVVASDVPSVEPSQGEASDGESAALETASGGVPASDPAKTDTRRTLVTRSSLAAAAGVPTITSATLTMDGDVVTLRLTGNQALAGKAFVLKQPDRVVLDLEGLWKVEAPRVPSNRMLKALRVGNQANATRLVFDMKVSPARATLDQADASTLELRIR